MSSETILPSFLSLFSIISFFIAFLVNKFSKNIKNGALLDQDFLKPQAFHDEPIARGGGLASIISLTIFFFLYYFLFNQVLFEYLILSIAMFLIGFPEDIKLKIKPSYRLVLMILALSLFITIFSVDLKSIDLIFLNTWMKNNLFQIFFLLLCFLFIINGANLIDGFNGLLTIHLIIINLILLFININSSSESLITQIVAQIIVLFTFLLFNFPKAKMFLGDGGSYLFGGLIALNIINTNNLNPQISSFFFSTLLFYLFFEVFFSFFRKIYLRKSPFNPDENHLHMLFYNFLKKSEKFKENNYLNSIIINSIYVCLILPVIFFHDNGLVCRYWFFSLMAIYMVFYYLLYSFKKKH